MWQKYNPNPCGRAVGDCAVRAVSRALDTDWETAYLLITSAGFSMCDMPSSNSVWGAVLRRHGFTCQMIDEDITFGEFADENLKGIFVLGSGSHTATVIDGILFDAWDSSGESIMYIWKKV